jgi:hypothetical protein
MTAIIRRPLTRAIEKGEDIVYTIRNDGIMCDVGSSHPGAVVGPKGLAVRQLKRYAIWVQNVEKHCVSSEQLEDVHRLYR